jgi:hypothetical protein
VIDSSQCGLQQIATPDVFTDPVRLDLLEADNRWLGPNFCFEAPLARLGAQVGPFKHFLGRLRRLFLTDQAINWRPNNGPRGLTKPRVEFESCRVTITLVNEFLASNYRWSQSKSTPVINRA